MLFATSLPLPSPLSSFFPIPIPPFPSYPSSLSLLFYHTLRGQAFLCFSGPPYEPKELQRLVNFLIWTLSPLPTPYCLLSLSSHSSLPFSYLPHPKGMSVSLNYAPPPFLSPFPFPLSLLSLPLSLWKIHHWMLSLLYWYIEAWVKRARRTQVNGEISQ